jgi:hypothetical protein
MKPFFVPQFVSVTYMSKADREYLADVEKMMKEHVDAVTKTPEMAFQELVDAGIYQADGQLAEQYR